MWSSARFFAPGLAGVSVLVTLSGCGFHPAGEVPLPRVMRVTYIESNDPYGHLENLLRRALTDSGVTVTGTRDRATAVLDIERTTPKRRLLAVNNLGRPVQYMLIYRVRYRLLAAGGRVLIPEREIRLERTYAYSVRTELASGRQADALLASLQRTVSRLILLRLRTYPRSPAQAKGTRPKNSVKRLK